MKAMLLLLLGAAVTAAAGQVDVYSAKELEARGEKLAQKRTQFAGQDLARYGNHYTLLACRNGTGSSEVHEHEADIFVIESGEAILVTGGKMIHPRRTAAGEIRGSSIEGGERQQIGPGAIIHIAAGTPHQLLIEKNKTLAYFVIKVTGQ